MASPSDDTATVPPRYALDGSVRRSQNGRVLVGGAPARVVRLTAEGSAILDAALAGRPTRWARERELIGRLETHGLIHPSGWRTSAADRVTTIVPARNAASGLRELVAALLAGGDVIVVDDGSTDGTADVARSAGARVLPNAGPPGPSAARNTGLRAARTEFVAFVDSDCTVRRGWHDVLIAHFEDPRLAIAAPRVAGLPRPSRLARYEQSFSPLDLGEQPGLVGPRHRLPYLPSAALLSRRTALVALDGFDPELHVGEDVDLVWRCVEAGWLVRYDPRATVLHAPRRTLRAFARQRYGYGTSAPLLEQRHPGAAAPLHVSPHTVGIWAAGALLGPAGAGGALVASSLAAVANAHPSVRLELARLVAGGHLNATRHLTRVISREWLPVLALGFPHSAHIRRFAAIAFALDMIATARRPLRPRDIAAQSGLRALDNAAYSAGLWRSMLTTRSFAAAKVRIGNVREDRLPVAGS